MRPPCEIVQRNFLRVVRTSVARALSKDGFSQTEIASNMNLTQAAVSKYLNQPVVKTKLASEIEILTNKLTEMIRNGDAAADMLVREICSTCMRSRLGSTLCEIHQEKIPSLKAVNCQVCAQLLSGSNDDLSERAVVISDMVDALRIIETSESFVEIVPQVRANLVVCNRNANSTEDVAGVPGRITIIDGRARALVSPQFGTSHHTAELLLDAKDTWTKIRSCLCVSGRDAVVKSAKKIGFKVVSLHDPESTATKIVTALKSVEKIPGTRTTYPAIHIPGGIGVEPILYLFGPNARELSARCVNLSESLK